MKKLFILILFCSLQSCVFETSGLKIKIVNNSKNNLIIGELSSEVGDCDSCSIMGDVKYYCQKENKTIEYPIFLKSNDSIDVQWKLFTYQKIYLINADSLNEYCNKNFSYNIVGKKWVKIMKEKVDVKNKVCSFIINK